MEDGGSLSAAGQRLVDAHNHDDHQQEEDGEDAPKGDCEEESTTCSSDQSEKHVIFDSYSLLFIISCRLAVCTPGSFNNKSLIGRSSCR